MTQTIIFSSRLLGSLLLFILALNIISCKKMNKVESKSKQTIEEKKVDSLVFSVKLPAKKSTGFNIFDKYGGLYYLGFVNRSNKDTTIIKKIPRLYNNQIINFGGGRFIEGKIIEYNHNYLVTKNTVKLSFKYNKGNVVLINVNNNVIVVDSLFEDYKKIRIKIFKSKRDNNKLKNELDTLNKFYQKKYKDEKLLIKLNEHHYIEKLQRINPSDLEVNMFVTEFKDSTFISLPLSDIFYFYVKNNINGNLNFNELNSNNFSKEFIKLFSMKVFGFLKFEDNKGDRQYKDAINWLKTTDLYKQDSIYIKNEITPLNNKVFKNKLKSLVLLDTSFNNTSFSKMLKKNPSKYYLIDFWATWCAPCIEGVNSMKKMRFPKNVKIISLSLDKIKVKDKWQTKTKELEQKISYLVDKKNQKNKEFLKFIELQSVPRYILIDKNMNLIDGAFLHPNELQFLSKLKDVKNHKYW